MPASTIQRIGRKLEPKPDRFEKRKPNLPNEQLAYSTTAKCAFAISKLRLCRLDRKETETPSS